MAATATVDYPIAPYAILETRGQPPRPPVGLAAVLLDEADSRSELTASIDLDEIVTVSLYAHGLEARGRAAATIRRFPDRSALAVATVPLAGYDTATDQCVTGNVSLAISWSAPGPDGTTEVAGTALAEGTWGGRPLRFAAVDGHRFNHNVFRLAAQPPPRTDRTIDA
ncbi:MAG: hypothetical protein AAGK32_13805, partial [Actinomycetota bacterium]